MHDDPALEPAHPFVETLQTNITAWRTAFLEAVRHAGEVSFRTPLEQDSDFWSHCEGMYGQGLAYRARVAEEFATWFDHPDSSSALRRL